MICSDFMGRRPSIFKKILILTWTWSDCPHNLPWRPILLSKSTILCSNWQLSEIPNNFSAHRQCALYTCLNSGPRATVVTLKCYDSCFDLTAAFGWFILLRERIDSEIIHHLIILQKRIEIEIIHYAFNQFYTFQTVPLTTL